MLGSLVVSVLLTAARADNDTNSSIDELQDEQAKIEQRKKELEARKKELANQKAQIKSNITGLENERYTLCRKKQLLDESIEVNKSGINNINVPSPSLKKK
jgi:chromosome segregation ATPase